MQRIRMDARKKDTRRKIELGGLVIKAGLQSEADAVILGVLTLAAETLSGSNSDTQRARFSAEGDARFQGEIHAQN